VESAGPRSPSETLFGRHEFLIRRLHSLSGLIPVGAYMVVHLLTNASVLNGAETFQKQVDTIHSLGIVLPVVEWTFIFIPLLFHTLIGIWIIRSGHSNTSSYPLNKNFRYTLQRATGMIAMVFILYHVLQLHWMGTPVGGGKFDPHHATSSAAGTIQAAVWIPIVYAVGVLACVYHLANGLWTMGITWGVWTTPSAQRRADYVCIAFGIGLALVGLSALFGMATLDVTAAQSYERVLEEERQAREEKIRQQGGSVPTGVVKTPPPPAAP
jgi:succinate dehydrogenase / fumarate reductase cytochrome b subunit